MQLLTNNGDAALSSYFHYFVHQGFGSFGELVPFKDSNWTIPHYLLGSSYNFNELLNTFMATVQALWQVREFREKLSSTLPRITNALLMGSSNAFFPPPLSFDTEINKALGRPDGADFVPPSLLPV